jgi:hypothetical protein
MCASRSAAQGEISGGRFDLLKQAWQGIVVEHLGRRPPQNADAAIGQPLVSKPVVAGLVRMSMAGAIDLDRQARPGAVEIQDAGTDRAPSTASRSPSPASQGRIHTAPTVSVRFHMR